MVSALVKIFSHTKAAADPEFPLGGANPIVGGASMSNVGAFGENKESGPVEGAHQGDTPWIRHCKM